MTASKLPCTRIAVLCVFIVFMIEQSEGLNLGLFAGDNKRHSNPLFIKKESRLSPVFININSALPRLSTPNLSLPKLPPRIPPLKLAKPKLPKLKGPLARKVPRSLLAPMIPPILPMPILPPIIPKLPILPIIPPLLPPLVPPLPILPIPFLPPLLPIPKLPKPIKVPILSKSLLQKALGSELKPVAVPLASSIAAADNKKVLDKLLELKAKGSLNTAEFIRFKRLLLHK